MTSDNRFGLALVRTGDREFGKWLSFGLSSPADTDIVTLNNDTPYSYACWTYAPSRGC
jgi:hypothetical protein